MNHIVEQPNVWIPLTDGRRLAAKLWLPATAASTPVPALLEYLPYRKRDGTAQRDASNYPIFARAGYAGVRVDCAGHGESDGHFDDEYSEQELSDGEEVITWIAQQPWCNGAIGMMGISWGGFNSLQLAWRQPPALRAVISLNSVVDRYNDDIHHKGGCQLSSNFSWANVMLCYGSRCPDPLLRADWREQWLHRLATQPWPLELWLAHQRRDQYWEHGSVCSDYRRMQIPALVISGWADLYVNAPAAAVRHFPTASKAIVGPWIHKYPHFAWPRPRLDFHAEALRWWDHWLKGIQNGVEQLPAYRAYIVENSRTERWHAWEQGRWVQQQSMDDNIEVQSWYLAPNQRLQPEAPPPAQQIVCSPLDCGTSCGELYTLYPDGELPQDQRYDDAASATFELPIGDDGLELLGAPQISLRLCIDQPLGNLIVRLLDVHPDGMSHRISWGVLNLSHRHSAVTPQHWEPDKFETVQLMLDQCAYRLLPGHRLRVAIATSYWPAIQPPPHLVTLTLHLGECHLTLPVYTDGAAIELPEPPSEHMLPSAITHTPAVRKRWVERDLQNLETHYHVLEDTGITEQPDHGLCTRHLRDEYWSIITDEPLSAKAHGVHTFWLSRNDWSVRTECRTELRCDATHFHTTAVVLAFEDDLQIHERRWQRSFERDFM